MSAAEVIEQIKALPAEEQARVAEYVRGSQTERQAPRVKYISKKEAEVISDRVFENNDELFRKLAQ